MMMELSEKQIAIKRAAREFAEKEFTSERGRKIDENYEFPWGLYRKAAEVGFIGISLPEEYGGQGLGCIEDCLVTEEFSRADSTLTAIFHGAGVASLVSRFGAKEQKEKYIPPICRGESVCAMALTEPNHGSDAGVTCLETTAVREGHEWVINGTKTFITCGDISDFVVVCCQTDTKASPPYRGVSQIIVEKGTPGIEATSLKPKMGFRGAPIVELSFNNVRVALNNILGQSNKGFYQLMGFFNYSRIPIAATAVGIAQGAFERSLEYSVERKQFSQPIQKFQFIQGKIAEMAIRIEAARLLTLKAAWLLDNKPERRSLVTLHAAMAKAFAAQVAIQVTNEAMQIHGGYGYVDSDIERYYRDARILDIIEGTGEIQRYIVARECYREKGLPRP
ncbi:MAG: acyl-CoA dehydrogenase family protein [Candidatus Hodarchaeota archaeon]